MSMLKIKIKFLPSRDADTDTFQDKMSFPGAKASTDSGCTC